MAKKQLNVRLPERSHKVIDNWSQELEITQTEFVARAIDYYDSKLWEELQARQPRERWGEKGTDK